MVVGFRGVLFGLILLTQWNRKQQQQRDYWTVSQRALCLNGDYKSVITGMTESRIFRKRLREHEEEEREESQRKDSEALPPPANSLDVSSTPKHSPHFHLQKDPQC